MAKPLARPALVIGAVVVAAQLVVASRYGWHRDELYFVACGRHLAWGYVDQPPFTPAVARLATAVFGASLVGLRLAPALADGLVVVLVAVMARDLGGGHRAQTVAATAVGLATVILALGHLLSTATFDALAWSGLTAVTVRVLRTGDPRWWVVAGVVVGVGLENKYTVAFLVAAVVVGVLAFRRDVLRGPWPWVGAALAALIWSPNLVWQAHHAWPVADMSRSLHAKGVDDGNTYLFLPMQLLFLGPVVTPLWIAGLWWSASHREGRRYRPLAVAWLVLTVGFVATAGKPYYLAGMYPFLLAAGSVWLADTWRPTAVRRYLAVVAVVGVVATPLALPLLPIGSASRGPISAVNPEFRESYGWREFTRTVARVPGNAVFTANYGEAGALQRFTPRRPVYSGHNNYWLWGPPPADTEPVVVVGKFVPAHLAAYFRDCRRQATIDNPARVPNQERGAGVWSCAGPAQSWNAEWPALRHYTA